MVFAMGLDTVHAYLSQIYVNKQCSFLLEHTRRLYNLQAKATVTFIGNCQSSRSDNASAERCRAVRSQKV